MVRESRFGPTHPRAPRLPLALWLLNNCHHRRVTAYVHSLPTCGRATERAGSLQRLQHDAQALVLDRKAIAKLGTRQHRAVGQKINDSPLETASPFRPELGKDLPIWVVSALVATSSRSTGGDAGAARCCAREDQVFLRSPAIEVRVGQDLEIAEAARSLTGGDSWRSSARVIRQQDQDVELPLQLNPSPRPTPLLTSPVAGVTSAAAE